MELHRNFVERTVTKEPFDGLGRPGPFIKVTELFDDGSVVVGWYRVADALRLANELRRAASL